MVHLICGNEPPLIGENLIEFHAIADAIETAPMDSFRMIELGVGYGRWLVNPRALSRL